MMRLYRETAGSFDLSDVALVRSIRENLYRLRPEPGVRLEFAEGNGEGGRRVRLSYNISKS